MVLSVTDLNEDNVAGKLFAKFKFFCISQLLLVLAFPLEYITTVRMGREQNVKKKLLVIVEGEEEVEAIGGHNSPGHSRYSCLT